MSLFNSLVPDPERSLVDWQAIDDAFGWFRQLKDCPQDSVFHGEGDVHIHTKMVVEALLADPDWQRLETEQRTTIFWAALLHDVAKPTCTRIAPDGRIIAPGHSRRGQIMARHILWRMDVPYHQREEICHLITHHQVPFFLIENEKPERRAHVISYQTRCDLLAILAQADARGRHSSDLTRLLDNIALFKELCREENCLSTPKSFASAHSRFLYFRKEDRTADYEAFDDWQGEATLLSGLPASGKDTWLATHANGREIISLDDIRHELDIDPRDSQGPVITAARDRARIALRAKHPFIWNATNISRQIRRQLIDLIADYKAKVRIIYLETSEEEKIRRNNTRERPVPAKIIARMLDRWVPPDLTECHDLKIVLT